MSGQADPVAPRPCVVHLVRAANGPEVFAAFLGALRRVAAGTGYDLVLAMKGFDRRSAADPYLALAGDTLHEVCFVPDEGLDLGTYFTVARELGRDRYCFLNSFSEPLAEGWLAKLAAALSLPGAGLAGATGSWASTRSWTAHTLRLPSAYRGVLPPPREAIAQFMALDAAAAPTAPAARLPASRLPARLRAIVEAPRQTLPYERFPADHVRTNAFMISAATLAALALPVITNKRDAYLVENGRHSITRQVQRGGLRTLVVDRDGVAYDHQHWHRSRTFWQGAQEGLLVADNQTRLYQESDMQRRRLLSGFAWGRDGEPSVP